MSDQIKLNKKLLFYIFAKKDFPNKKKLKKIVCKDNERLKRYFTNSYRILEYTEVIINEKLNSELNDIYERDIFKIRYVKLFVDILINLLQDYKKSKDDFNKYLKEQKILVKNYFTYERYLKHVIEAKNSIDGQEIRNLESAIKDLYVRFIYAKNSEKYHIENPTGSYRIDKDIPYKSQTVIELSFREVLHQILDLNMTQISEKDIKKIVSYHYNCIEPFANKDRKEEKYSKKNLKLLNTSIEDRQRNAIINAKNTIITALKDLKLIEEEIEKKDTDPDKVRLFKLIEIKDTDWKMNAKTKNDTINSLIGGISDMNNVSPKSKKLVRFIFNYMGNYIEKSIPENQIMIASF